jgi:hypothetical protein
MLGSMAMASGTGASPELTEPAVDVHGLARLSDLSGAMQIHRPRSDCPSDESDPELGITPIGQG